MLEISPILNINITVQIKLGFIKKKKKTMLNMFLLCRVDLRNNSNIASAYVHQVASVREQLPLCMTKVAIV